MMLKQLLISAALATVAISASAESKVLWQADSPEGDPIQGWNTFYEMTSEQAAVFNAGDAVYMTITAKGTEGWPQVALFEGGVGWPPFANAGAGDAFPNKVIMKLTPENVEAVHANGISFRGESVYVSEIGYEASTIKVDPNAVWIGPKQLNWGDGIGIQSSVFSDLKVGDKIVVVYDKASESTTLQIILGAWKGENAGPNVATYQADAAKDFMTIDEEAGTVTIEFTEALSNLTWGDEPKDYDVFATVKAAGVQMQGPGIIINQVLYIPGEVAEEPVFPEDIKYTLNGEQELAGVTVTQGYDDDWETHNFNVSGKCSADEITIKFETPNGWDGILVPPSYGDDINPLKTRGEYDWAPLDEMLDYGFKESNELTFAVDGEEYETQIAFYKGDQVYQTMLYVYFAVEKEGEVAEEPVFPETIEYTINGEKELAGVEVVIKDNGYGPEMSVMGESDAESIVLTFAVPEGWDGWIISAPFADVTEQSVAKTRSDEDWKSLDHCLNNEGYQKGNTVTFAVEELDNWATLALYKGDQVYYKTLSIEYNVVPAGGVVVTDPVFPESLGVSTYAEGLVVDQNNEDGEIFIAVTGEIEETTFDVVLDVPEGWTGFISIPDSEDVTIGEGNEGPSDPRMSKVQEAEWVPMEDVMDEGIFLGNKFTFKANGTRQKVEVHLYKDDMVDVANFITLTANVKSKLVEANQAAYEEVIGKIEAVEKEYAEALEALKKEYPEYDFTEWETIIGGQLTQAKEGATQALASANEDNTDFNFAFDEEEFQNMISEMNTKVSLLASNQAAYEAVIAQIDALQEKYDAAVAKIKESNPDFDFSEYEEILTMIDQYKGGAAQALATANEEGEEFFFPFDGSEIEGFISMMLMAGDPAPEFPTSLDVTLSNNEGVELTIDDSQGIFVINVTGKSSEEELTITVAVPEGFDGFVSMRDIDMDPGIGGGPLLTTRAQESEWWPISALLETGAKEGNTMTFPVDGELHAGQFCICKNGFADVSNQINVEFEVESNATVGVSGVNAAENATFYDLQGNRIAKPAKGMYVKVVNGKATKVAVR